jgi:hypothetical protein
MGIESPATATQNLGRIPAAGCKINGIPVRKSPEADAPIVLGKRIAKINRNDPNES